MKRSEFIKILIKEYILYEIKDDIISILGNECGYVNLDSLESLPENLQFNNSGDLNLDSLESLPENTQFNNGGYVDLCSLESLPENTQFNNGGSIFLESLESLPESTQFNNGVYIFLNSLESLPENIKFNNGGSIYFKNKKLVQKKSYIERNNLEVKDDKVILYKKVSEDFLTQENAPWKTHWKIGNTLVHPNWNPKKNECGSGKFHACARPFWCDHFRHNKDDKYIAIEVKVEDLYEWPKPNFPQKIAFRCGRVLYECDRYGNKIQGEV